MCGRYSLNLKSSQSEFKLETIINNKEIFSFNNPDISPSSLSPIIFRNEKKYNFEISRWGFSFDWLPKDRVLFNIRSETIDQKSFSTEILKSHSGGKFSKYTHCDHHFAISLQKMSVFDEKLNF